MIILIKKSVLNYARFWVISIFLVFPIKNTFAQDAVIPVLDLANTLHENSVYNEAITEYLRVVFWADDEQMLHLAHYGMGLCFRELSQWDKAIRAFRNAKNFAPNDSIRHDISIAISTVYLAMGKNNQAQLALMPVIQLSKNPNLKNQAIILIITSAILQKDWSKVGNFVDIFGSQNEELSIQLNKLLTEVSRHIKKSPETAKWLSTFLPGSGQLYAQDYGNALNAFLLNALNFGATGYFIYEKEYHNAILYFLFLTERYYSGNRYQAQRSVLRYEAHMNNEFYLRALEIIKEIKTTD